MTLFLFLWRTTGALREKYGAFRDGVSLEAGDFAKTEVREGRAGALSRCTTEMRAEEGGAAASFM